MGLRAGSTEKELHRGEIFGLLIVFNDFRVGFFHSDEFFYNFLKFRIFKISLYVSVAYRHALGDKNCPASEGRRCGNASAPAEAQDI